MEFSLEQTLMAWMIAGTRVTGMIVSAPFFGSLSIPVRIKIGLGLVFTMMMAPLVSKPGVSLPASGLLALLASEAATGFLLGFTLQIVFKARRILLCS